MERHNSATANARLIIACPYDGTGIAPKAKVASRCISHQTGRIAARAFTHIGCKATAE
jgi:hypothetical protein